MPKTKNKSVKPDDSALFLSNQLCFALYAASLAMSKTYRPLLTPLGLTFPQYVVMMALWQHKQLTAGVLAQTVALDAGTLVPLVRKLVAQGLLQRERSQEDERSVIISLTAAGQALQKRAHDVYAQAACATQCSLEQRQALTAQLQSLRAALSHSP
jgi:DNA-binding MarR family transcriptional regulator